MPAPLPSMISRLIFLKNKQADLLKLRRKSGMVFQDYHLFPHRTVLENVMEGPVQVQRRPKEAVRKEAIQLLQKVGLEDKKICIPSSCQAVKSSVSALPVHLPFSQSLCF